MNRLILSRSRDISRGFRHIHVRSFASQIPPRNSNDIDSRCLLEEKHQIIEKKLKDTESSLELIRDLFLASLLVGGGIIIGKMFHTCHPPPRRYKSIDDYKN